MDSPELNHPSQKRGSVGSQAQHSQGWREATPPELLCELTSDLGPPRPSQDAQLEEESVSELKQVFYLTHHLWVAGAGEPWLRVTHRSFLFLSSWGWGSTWPPAAAAVFGKKPAPALIPGNMWAFWASQKYFRGVYVKDWSSSIQALETWVPHINVRPWWCQGCSDHLSI